VLSRPWCLRGPPQDAHCRAPLTSAPLNPPPPAHPQRVLPRCFTEVMLRIANPVREMAPGMFKTGPKGARRARGGGVRAAAARGRGGAGRGVEERQGGWGPGRGRVPRGASATRLCAAARPRTRLPLPPPAPPNPGAAAFKEFQDQMRFLLKKIREDGEPAADNYDIGAQVGACGVESVAAAARAASVTASAPVAAPGPSNSLLDPTLPDPIRLFPGQPARCTPPKTRCGAYCRSTPTSLRTACCRRSACCSWRASRRRVRRRHGGRGLESGG
jgi:hypothetical protein